MPGTVVDSSVLLDVFTEDRTWLAWSEGKLAEAAGSGALFVNSIVLAEVSPRFPRIEALRSALRRVKIEEIPDSAAFLAGHAHAKYRRSGGSREAVLPDFLIGAHAAVTRQTAAHARPAPRGHTPGVELIAPA